MRRQPSLKSGTNTKKTVAYGVAKAHPNAADSEDPADISPHQAPAAGDYTPTIKKGGRQTQPINANPFGILGYSFIPRLQWQNITYNDIFGGIFTAQQIMEVLPEISPDVSKALWNTLRLCNPGWDNDFVKVYKMDGETIDKNATDALKLFISGVNRQWGGINNVIDQYFSSAFLEGAVASELVLSEDLKQPLDLFSVDCWTIYFQRDVNQELVPFQQQIVIKNGGQPFVRLNTSTFCYIPLDPRVDDPYGRVPASAALQETYFLMRMLDDLGQVIHNQAWPRTDATIIEESIRNNMPPQYKGDKNKENKFVNKMIGDITAVLEQLKPDDVFVHTESLTFNKNGAVEATLPDIKTIVDVLRMQVIVGLKQLPILMGLTDSSTEAKGTVEYEIYVAGIKSLQRKVENVLENHFMTALNVLGFQSIVEVEFPDIKASNRLIDAQSESLEIENAATMRDQGWMTQDEASIIITGTEAVADAPTPVQVIVQDPNTIADEQGKPATPAASTDDTGATTEENQTQNNAKKKVSMSLENIRKKAVRDYQILEQNTESIESRKKTFADRLEDIKKTDPKADPYKMNFLYTPEGLELERRTYTAISRIWQRVESGLLAYIYKHATGKNSKQNRVTGEFMLTLIKQYFNSTELKSIRKEYNEVLKIHTTDGFELSGKHALYKIGIIANFKLDSPELRKQIDARAEEVSKGTFKTLNAQMESVIKQGIEQDKSVDAIARDLRDEFNIQDAYKPVQIADTELNYAMSRAALETYSRNGIDGKSWDTSGGPRVCSRCSANMDDGVIPIDALFSDDEGEPPAHPDCDCVLVPEILDYVPPEDPWTGQ